MILSSNKKYKYVVLGLLVAILYISIPFIVIVFLYIIYSKTNSNKIAQLASILAILFMTILNYGKSIEGDLILYNNWYLYAQNVSMSIYMMESISDPAFHLFLFFHSRLIGNFHLFVALTTFIIYGVYFYAISKFVEKRKEYSNYMVLVFFLFVFLNETFSLSAHLIRQFMAGSLFLASVIQTKKRRIVVFLVLAIFTHFSVSIFALIFLFRRNRRRYFIYKILLCFFALLFVNFSSIIFTFIGVLRFNTSYLNNIFGRFSVIGVENAKDAGILGIVLLSANIFALCVIKVNPLERRISLLSIFVSLLTISFFPYQLLYLRYFIFLYLLLPLSFFFYGSKEKRLLLISKMFIFAILVRFSFIMNNILWNYDVKGNLFFYSPIFGNIK